ncbi:putative phenylacetic acid degradation protein [Cupriavidus basilensis]|uniref:Putative phenylacetic acid degradation protein n=1 Tax=Cupriavidus basilensis TaxID=68895 RepID=A0A0C4Y9K2_9BURK|nr:putative phenylacetic acid degradation protein [Cupriavidus basilensis]
MSDSADPMLAHGREVLASQPFSVMVGADLAAPVATSEYKINYLRPAIGDTLIARLGEGS